MQVEVRTRQDMLKCFAIGQQLRTIGTTNQNQKSSRSHTIFRVLLRIKGEDAILSSEINLVDLAGSEAVSRNQAEGIWKEEGVNIN